VHTERSVEPTEPIIARSLKPRKSWTCRIEWSSNLYPRTWTHSKQRSRVYDVPDFGLYLTSDGISTPLDTLSILGNPKTWDVCGLTDKCRFRYCAIINFTKLGVLQLGLSSVVSGRYHFYKWISEPLSCPQNSPTYRDDGLVTDRDYARFNGEINDISRWLPNYYDTKSPPSILCILINNE